MSHLIIALDHRSFFEPAKEFLGKIVFLGDTSIHIISVVEPTQAAQAWPSQEYRKQSEELVLDAVAFFKTAFPDFHILGSVIEGYAADEILKSALSWNADLIIMGAHNKNQYGRFFGSVSGKVSNLAQCPVVVVRPAKPLPMVRAKSVSQKTS